MPTGRSSPEAAGPRGPGGPDGHRERGEVRRAVADVGHLLRFRARTARRGALAGAGAALAATTVAVAVLPAVAAGAGRGGGAAGAGPAAGPADLLPLLLAAHLAVTVTAAVASGGGRELLARDPAAIHPIGPTTDHLGTLVLAPVSTGWLLQAWALLGVAAYAAGTAGLAVAGLLVAAWVLAATAAGQLAAWAVEWLRRGPAGALGARSATLLVAAVAIGLGAAPGGRDAVARGPLAWVADAALGGPAWPAAGVLLLAVAGLLALLGGVLAHRVAARPPRDETRLESRTHAARPDARTELAALVRLDRGSVWRSVPLRRGTGVLALGPGLFALARGMEWGTVVLLPGLVASGCVLLFGVNAWCLDGRGLVWRETLPVAPGTQLAARALVIGELLLGAGLVALGLGAVRAGVPSTAELAATAGALLVVTGQALSGALRWSLRSPYAADLRSARATPAPPLVMVGYSLRLALVTTLTGLWFSGLAAIGRVDLVAASTVVLLGWSAWRIAASARGWRDPVRRARVVAVVTG